VKDYLRHSFFLVFLFLVAVLSGCSNPAAKLPVFESVPEFQATDSHNRPFTRDEMSGKVWIVDFIYTNCPAACPMMSSKMRHVAVQLEGDDDVRILSISVDSARDTPAALHEFASRYGGGNEQWHFITTSPENVHRLAFETFHLGDVLGKIEHSTKFVVVDKRGRIRGYYSSLNSDDLNKMRSDVEGLRRITS
jgi:protein SCO1/2